MIEQLATPVARKNSGVPVQATHRAIGVTIAPWQDPAVTVSVTEGVMVDGQYVSVHVVDQVTLDDEELGATARTRVAELTQALYLRAQQARTRRSTPLFADAQRSEVRSFDGSITMPFDRAMSRGFTVVANGVEYEGVRRNVDGTFSTIAPAVQP